MGVGDETCVGLAVSTGVGGIPPPRFLEDSVIHDLSYLYIPN
jgi:hypothetical protein